MKNQDIRNNIQNAGVKHWQVADQLGIHEGMFSRLLRKELSEGRKDEVKEAIKKVEEELKEVE